MRIEVKMPRMGQSMEEGTILNWLKPIGAEVKAGDALVEIETDKATIEIETFTSGKLVEVLVQNGETVAIGTVLGYIEDERVATSPKPQEVQTSSRIHASPVVKRLAKEQHIDLSTINGTGPDGRIIKRDIAEFLGKISAKPLKTRRLEVSPVARRLAKEHQINLADIRGSGPDGRVIKHDIEAHLASNTANALSTINEPIASSEKQALSKIKQATARLMVESKTTVPHFYISIDINMGQALALRQSLKNRGHRVSVNHLVLKASAMTLSDYPNLNAEWRDNNIFQHTGINIATAVALMNNERPTGLITPVIHNCEALSLIILAQATDNVIERARSGKLRGRDLNAGTFTVSNLGMFGVKHFEAIVNPPQAAILAVGAIRRIPSFDAQDNVVPIQMMTATLSADHRVTDGAEVASFMRDFKAILEDAFALLMDQE